MIVSFNWLADYLQLDISADELATRLMMAGLNHEESHQVGDDLAIDLEVTSNRPDCLGHLGIAREAAALLGQPLKVPAAAPKTGGSPVGKLTSVELQCPDLCPHYTARVLRGVKVGPSPAWLIKRLETVYKPKNAAFRPINNIVDITNYVLLECGQPLHAFDLQRLAEQRIVVRRARPGEKIEAIDHRPYELTADMCVIADARRPVAIGGVMGGASTEVTGQTTDLLIESARFTPLSIRTTARQLGLHSDSSYRFERGVDPAGVDWASRRCCQLILEIAGGTLAEGVVDMGRGPAPREPIVLRFSQLKRILGIDVPAAEAKRILLALGLKEMASDAAAITAVPPSWRADLSREIDLVEEVGRVHGYDNIPEDVSVPMSASARGDDDRVMSRLRHVLTSAGFDEAMTASVVEEPISAAFSPWTKAEPLVSSTALLRRADRLRRSVVPSLLAARRFNEAQGNECIELFETARVYLPRPGELPHEEPVLALTSGAGWRHAKGTLEALLGSINPALELEAKAVELPLLAAGRSAELRVAGELWGYLGEVSAEGLRTFGVRSGATVAEVKISLLVQMADLARRYQPLPDQPAMLRDLNLVLDDSVRWADLADTVRSAAGNLLERLVYQDTYRDREKLGPGRKSLLLSLVLRDPQRTLSGEEADRVTQQVVQACAERHKAQLRA